MLWCLLALCDSQSWATFSLQRRSPTQPDKRAGEFFVHPAAAVKAEMLKQYKKRGIGNRGKKKKKSIYYEQTQHFEETPLISNLTLTV